MRDIHETLELWGAWAASDNSGVDFPPIAAGFKKLIPATSKSRMQCDDDIGMLYDAAIGKLKIVGKYEELELIFLHYVFDISKRKIAKIKKISEREIRRKLQIAETFIEACIYMLCL